MVIGSNFDLCWMSAVALGSMIAIPVQAQEQVYPPHLPQLISEVAAEAPQPLMRVELEPAAPMSQINNVSQFRDVNPGDWAYSALSDLVARYDCLRGYPDGTFRGNRALSRYEFAAGLNACLQAMERLVAETAANAATAADLEILQQLMNEFEIELANLGQRVDNLTGRVEFLEDNQFSTTTKLFGQAVFGLQGRLGSRSDYLGANGLLGRDGVRESQDTYNNMSFGYNAQLTFLTEFNPRSFLITGLQAGNLTTNDTTTFFGFNNGFTRLGYESNTNNGLILSDLSFRHLAAKNLALIVGTAGVNPVAVFRGPSRVESAGFGPISRFAQRNPIIQLGAGSAGLGFDWQATPILSVQGVYSATFANLPTAGLFNNAYTAGLQVAITPTRNTDLALYYLNSYSGLSSGFLQTGVGDDQVAATNGTRLNTDAIGATANWMINDAITLGGWLGWTTSRQVNFGKGSVQTNNWMLSLQFPDLFAEGNYGGIFFGQPPRITGTNLVANGRLDGNIPSFFTGNGGTTNADRDGRTLHLEAFYRWAVTDNITITPGVVMLFNPGHHNNNETITIGALRTTFSF